MEEEEHVESPEGSVTPVAAEQQEDLPVERDCRSPLQPVILQAPKYVRYCHICGEKMNSPVLLPCLDQFCLACLKHYHELQREDHYNLLRVATRDNSAASTPISTRSNTTSNSYHTIGDVTPPLSGHSSPYNPHSSNPTSYSGGQPQAQVTYALAYATTRAESATIIAQHFTSTQQQQPHPTTLSTDSIPLDPGTLHQSADIVNTQTNTPGSYDEYASLISGTDNPLPISPSIGDRSQTGFPPSQTSENASTNGDSTDSYEDYLSFDDRYEPFRCPICSTRTNVFLVKNGADQLTINETLRNIERFTCIKEDLPQGKVNCSECGETAVGMCSHEKCVNTPFCTDCGRNHQHYKKLHIVANLNSFQFDDLKRTDALCREAVDGGAIGNAHLEPKKLYCVTHDKIMCRSCTAFGSLHSKCNECVQYCVNVHEQAKEVTEGKLRVVEQLHAQVEQAIKTTDELTESLEETFKERRDSIQKRYANLKKELKDERNQLLKNCDALYDHKKEELEHHRGKLAKVSATFKRCTEFVNWFKETAIASEFMSLKTKINERLDNLKETHSNTDYKSLEDNYIFFEENEQFSVTKGAIGRVYSTPSVKRFTLDPTVIDQMGAIMSNQPVTLSIVPRDAIDNDLRNKDPRILPPLPRLLVTLKHEDSGEITKGYIGKDRRSGRHFITICPGRIGRHELCVYRPMRPPHGDLYMEQKIFINASQSNIGYRLRVFFEKMANVLANPDYY